MNNRLILVACCVSLFVHGPTALAHPVGEFILPDSAVSVSSVAGRKQMKALRIPNNSMTIDGLLDESEWTLGEPVTDFWQREPMEGLPATEGTVVIALYDDDMLYIGARMYSKNPRNVVGGATRRDDLGFSEAVKISIDGYLDRKSSYGFGVTAAGVRRDHYNPIDDEIKARDNGFNPVWDARTSIDSLGWIAEMAIPFSQLRFYDRPKQVWGVNFNRYIPSRNEDVYWVARSKKDPGWASLFGDLVGIENIEPTLRLEVSPYAAGSANFTGGRDRNNPFDDGSNIAGRVGADLKMGLGPHFTLDGTMNPDFGQVEADPAVVNLTAFETFFTERRPFFVEGNKLLSNTNQVFFYSRRIGAAPLGPASGTYVDKPTNTTILGAGKVSGRLSSGLSIGALAALTAREEARIAGSPGDPVRTLDVEPMTAYGVARVEQEFGPFGSTVGVVATGVQRYFKAGSPLEDLLARQAMSGGGNWNIRMDRGTYELNGEVGFSHIEGSTRAMTRIQASSAHYFQRPDATFSRIDSSKKSLTGYSAVIGLNKYGGEHWLWGINALVESPEFELNDIGRMTAADDIDLSSNIRYRDVVPSPWYHTYDIGVTLDQGWNFEGIRQFTNIGLSTRLTWKSFWRTTLETQYRARAISDNLTRGGPLMGTPQAWRLAGSMASGVTRRTKMSYALEYEFDELGGWFFGADASLDPRPGDQWEFSVKPAYERSVTAHQYVTTTANPGNTTYGRRYIFAAIERSTLALQLRLTYNFTPDMSLEFYAEPFAASGRYYDFGELKAPGSSDVIRYGTGSSTIARNADGSHRVTDGQSFTISNRDFNVRSFRSNVVVRWEWRLGSTLYFVWQQDKSLNTPMGALVQPGALWESIETTGDNIIALKLNYWIPID
ncbi:MAG: carbohydrate binding family 9 domain-containing protein [Ignavibacteriales bacterium]|nr:carbohydrate binding family 9 domain-containing protein [Ignavibacteriales bacterium]